MKQCHLLCLTSLVLLITTAEIVSSQSAANWPRADVAVGIWPLNNFYKLQDISGNKYHGIANAGAYVDSTAGPFGDPQTSYKSTSSYGIFDVSSPISLNSSFTISFFIKAPYDGTTQSYGVLQWIDKASTAKSLAIVSNNQGAYGTLNTYANEKYPSFVQMFTHPAIWNFYAITFNSTDCKLTVYNRFGVFVKAYRELSICASFPYNNNGFRIGKGQNSFNWSPSLSVSCLSIYSDTLAVNYVMKIYDACRSVLNAVPCGSPRLPAIPSPPTVPPTSARAGQFPAMAFLKENGKFKCTAVIISQFWVLTAASCINSSLATSAYQVRAGYLDSEQTYSYAFSSSVFQFLIHKSFTNNAGRYQNDIALVELKSPIDMSSPYFNDICLPWYGDASVVSQSSSSTVFFAGWGENGRSALTSNTTLRYTAGKIQSDSSCSSQWGGSSVYNSANMMCMRSDYDSNVPCVGDEGGPLMVYENQTDSRIFASGIYSYRSDCSDSSKTPVFTKVAAYATWIYQKIGCTIPGYHYPVDCPWALPG